METNNSANACNGSKIFGGICLPVTAAISASSNAGEPKVDVNKVVSANYLQYGLSTAGTVGGIVLGISRKSGVWGTIGWAILGGVAGGAVAAVINSTRGNYVK